MPALKRVASSEEIFRIFRGTEVNGSNGSAIAGNGNCLSEGRVKAGRGELEVIVYAYVRAGRYLSATRSLAKNMSDGELEELSRYINGLLEKARA